jgi:hypothetical protein
MSDRTRNIVFPFVAVAFPILTTIFFIELAFVTISRLREGEFYSSSELVQREINSVQIDAQYKMKVQGEDCHWADLFRPHSAYLYLTITRPDYLTDFSFHGPARTEFSKNHIRCTFSLIELETSPERFIRRLSAKILR